MEKDSINEKLVISVDEIKDWYSKYKKFQTIHPNWLTFRDFCINQKTSTLVNNITLKAGEDEQDHYERIQAKLKSVFKQCDLNGFYNHMIETERQKFVEELDPFMDKSFT